MDQHSQRSKPTRNPGSSDSVTGREQSRSDPMPSRTLRTTIAPYGVWQPSGPEQEAQAAMSADVLNP